MGFILAGCAELVPFGAGFIRRLVGDFNACLDGLGFLCLGSSGVGNAGSPGGFSAVVGSFGSSVSP